MPDETITRHLATRYSDRDRLNLDVALGNLTAAEADALVAESQLWLMVYGDGEDA